MNLKKQKQNAGKILPKKGQEKKYIFDDKVYLCRETFFPFSKDKSKTFLMCKKTILR